MENNIELVQNENGQIVVSSRQIANDFKKRHDNVVRDVEGLLKNEDTPKTYFYRTTYINEQNGQSYKEYLIDRDGFSLLVMGFTGKKAMQWKLKYIEAFNAMEQQLLQQQQDSYLISDPIVRARKWIEEQEAAKALAEKVVEHEETIKVLAPKAELADRLSGAKDWVSIGEAAKLLAVKGLGQNNLFRFLQAHRVLIDSKHPYQRFVDRGYFKICERTYYNEYVDEDRTSLQVKISQKGIAYINKLIHGEEQEAI